MLAQFGTVSGIKDLQGQLNPGWPVEDPAKQKPVPDPMHPGEFMIQQQDGVWVERAPYFESVAVTGDGVFETLKSVAKMVLKTLS